MYAGPGALGVRRLPAGSLAPPPARVGVRWVLSTWPLGCAGGELVGVVCGAVCGNLSVAGCRLVLVRASRSGGPQIPEGDCYGWYLWAADSSGSEYLR